MTLNNFDELVLTLVMEKTQAWELLNNPDYCGRLTMGEVHQLMLRAGYSDTVAQTAASQRGWERMVAGEVM